MNKLRLLVFVLLAALLAAPLPGASPAHAEPAPVLAPEGAEAAEAAVPADWWAAVQNEIRHVEYEITWQSDALLPGVGGAYQAPNRAQNLRTYFTPGGPLVVPRVWPEGSETPPWRWGLRLVTWGWEGVPQPVDAPTLHP
ncbi:MAG: hypothetical protein JXA93_18045, partial [Anaerolineae bacterium]|nr:hypothetical protein [Anaerolineae bacterium]